MVDPSLKAEFEQCGRVWLRNAVSKEDLDLFDTATAGSLKAGQRLDSSTSLETALSPDSSLLKAVRRLSAAASPVRVVAFNKSETANWGVPWHQDRVISVAAKADVPGYHNWTNKSGLWHCEPPQHILEAMLFVRVHLDDTDHSNGAMQIALGSHAAGIVPSEQAQSVANRYPLERCEATRGDVLILKMLTLHSSKPAQVQTGRRVLRVDFSTSELPSPLAWNTRAAAS